MDKNTTTKDTSTVKIDLEKELDKKMDRTKNRPLPTNRITKTNSTIIANSW